MATQRTILSVLSADFRVWFILNKHPSSAFLAFLFKHFPHRVLSGIVSYSCEAAD